MTPTPTPLGRRTSTSRLWPSLTRRRLLAVSGAAGMTLTASTGRASAQATPEASPTGGAQIFEIPGDRVFPEGIAFDPTTSLFYVGSTEDGAVYRGNLATGVVEPFLSPGEDDRTEVTGLKVDPDGRLIVCGRRTGRIFVYDTASGALLARYANGREEGTLVNDAAITPDGVAYVTDSFAPLLYQIDLAALPASGDGGATPVGDAAEQEPKVFLEFDGTAFAYVEDDFNANGIVASEDGTTLLIVQFVTGQLYRVDMASGEVAEVALTGGDLRGGDGLALDGTTLYALLDTTGELVRVEMTEDLTEGEIGTRFVDPSFDYPTTLALVGDGTALVVNSQLDMAREDGTPSLPFTVSRVPLPA